MFASIPLMRKEKTELTKEKLQELGLPEETIAPVLALWDEREQSLRKETEQLRASQQREALERDLRTAGVRPALVPLLMTAAPEGATADMLREAYPDCFAREQPLPIPETSPPTGMTGSRFDTLRTLSPEEINRSWEEIRAELVQGAE